MASIECLHELNPSGGFSGSHGLFCGYRPECYTEATVHVRVTDRGWCGNVCGKCRERIGREHRIAVDGRLRGLSEESNDSNSN